MDRKKLFIWFLFSTLILFVAYSMRIGRINQQNTVEEAKIEFLQPEITIQVVEGSITTVGLNSAAVTTVPRYTVTPTIASTPIPTPTVTNTPTPTVAPTNTPTPIPTVVVEHTDLGEANKTYYGRFRLTAYCPCNKCNGPWAHKDANGNWYCDTSSGVRATEGRTIACNVLPLGTHVLINGHEYVVEDRFGGSDYSTLKIDVYHSSHAKALQFNMGYYDVYILD